MEHPEPKRSEVRRQIDQDRKTYEKILASGKYKGQHLLVEDGKIIIQESDGEAFWDKANKYNGKHALHVYVPTYVHPLHPLLGMYSK